jgi:hypothetical protein
MSKDKEVEDLVGSDDERLTKSQSQTQRKDPSEILELILGEMRENNQLLRRLIQTVTGDAAAVKKDTSRYEWDKVDDERFEEQCRDVLHNYQWDIQKIVKNTVAPFSNAVRLYRLLSVAGLLKDKETENSLLPTKALRRYAKKYKKEHGEVASIVDHKVVGIDPQFKVKFVDMAQDNADWYLREEIEAMNGGIQALNAYKENNTTPRKRSKS